MADYVPVVVVGAYGGVMSASTDQRAEAFLENAVLWLVGLTILVIMTAMVLLIGGSPAFRWVTVAGMVGSATAMACGVALQVVRRRRGTALEVPAGVRLAAGVAAVCGLVIVVVRAWISPSLEELLPTGFLVCVWVMFALVISGRR